MKSAWPFHNLQNICQPKKSYRKIKLEITIHNSAIKLADAVNVGGKLGKI